MFDRARRLPELVSMLACVSVLALAGCGTGTPQAGSGTSSSTPAQTPASTPSPAQAQNADGCRIAITISAAGREESAAGHVSTALLLRNNGSAACSLNGYPKVVALDSKTVTVAEAKQTTFGYMGGLMNGQPPTVTLAPGQAASALFEASAANVDGTACTNYASLRVTAPGQADPVTITWGLAGCGAPEIHPVVPGDTGRS